MAQRNQEPARRIRSTWGKIFLRAGLWPDLPPLYSFSGKKIKKNKWTFTNHQNDTETKSSHATASKQNKFICHQRSRFSSLLYIKALLHSRSRCAIPAAGPEEVSAFSAGEGGGQGPGTRDYLLVYLCKKMGGDYLPLPIWNINNS